MKKSDDVKFEYTITDELGIHARPAGALIQHVKNFDSKVTITLKDKTVDASSIISLMTLQAKTDDTIGADEKEAIEDIKSFMEENF